MMTSSSVALVMGDTRSPWPPPPSARLRDRLEWRASIFSQAVAIAGLYAQRWCYDLRVYTFVPFQSADTSGYKLLLSCAHERLGARASPWCKILAMHDTLSRGSSADGGATERGAGSFIYSYVVWIDSDILIHDLSRSVPHLLSAFSHPTKRAFRTPAYAWFATDWPWQPTDVNTAFFILSNSSHALQLLADAWSAPSGQAFNTRHKFEQEAFQHVVGSRIASGEVRLLHNWRHMTDLNQSNIYNTPNGALGAAVRGRAPTIHMTEQPTVVPATPPRDATFPSMLTALSLEALVDGRHVAVPARACLGRTLAFRMPPTNITLSGRRHPLPQVTSIEPSEAPHQGEARGSTSDRP